MPSIPKNATQSHVLFRASAHKPLCSARFMMSIAVRYTPKILPLPVGCESEVEQQQLLSLAHMLQARALQSRPNAPHRYSLTPASFTSLHLHPNPTPDESPVTGRSPSQAGGHGSISPSSSPPGALSHSHSQHAVLPLGTSCVQQSGPLMELKKQCQDEPPAADSAAQGTKTNQVCSDEGRSVGSYPKPSDKAGQANQESWGCEVHAADRLRSSSLPRAQPFHSRASRLGPLCHSQFSAQPVLPSQRSKVCSSHDFSIFSCT